MSADVGTDVETRWCPRCRQVLSLGAFGRRKRRGKVIPEAYCFDCHREYRRRWKLAEAARAAERAARRRYDGAHADRYRMGDGVLYQGPQADPKAAAVRAPRVAELARRAQAGEKLWPLPAALLG